MDWDFESAIANSKQILTYVYTVINKMAFKSIGFYGFYRMY